LLEHAVRVGVGVCLTAPCGPLAAASDAIVVMPELVGQDVQELIRARLGLGPAQLETTGRGRHLDAERRQLVAKLSVFARLVERDALNVEQIEEVAILVDHLPRPPVPEIVGPGADRDHTGPAPAGTIGRRVEDDRVEPDSDFVPVWEQPDESPKLGNGDQVARSLRWPAPVEADLVLWERAIVTRVQTPIVLLEHASVPDAHGGTAVHRHTAADRTAAGRVRPCHHCALARGYKGTIAGTSAGAA
jgi:hypothetical protein